MNSAKMQLENRSSIYHFYKKFIFQRKKIPYFCEEITFSRNEKVLIFFRGNKKELCCIFNLSEKEIMIKNSYGKIVSSLPSQNIKSESNELKLLPYAFGYLSKNDLSGFIN